MTAGTVIAGTRDGSGTATAGNVTSRTGGSGERASRHRRRDGPARPRRSSQRAELCGPFDARLHGRHSRHRRSVGPWLCSAAVRAVAGCAVGPRHVSAAEPCSREQRRDALTIAGATGAGLWPAADRERRRRRDCGPSRQRASGVRPRRRRTSGRARRTDAAAPRCVRAVAPGLLELLCDRRAARGRAAFRPLRRRCRARSRSPRRSTPETHGGAAPGVAAWEWLPSACVSSPSETPGLRSGDAMTSCNASRSCAASTRPRRRAD